MSENTLKTRIRHAVKKESEWVSSNPVLLSGEIAYNSDNDKYKVGNGTSTWSQLSYKIPVTKSDIGLGNVENKSSATIRGELTKANVTTALGYTPPTTNTTYGVATSSTLGLVKSGTDITVDSSGNVSVNDDSHNHVISNVDGLQGALDAKATKTTLTNQNLNSIVTPGFYNAGGGNTVANKPSGIEHFGLIVIHRAMGEYYTQILFDDTSSYRRFCVNGNWSGWTQDQLTDTDTWRGIQNNLTSTSTTDSLSANQGRLLANGSARDNTKLPLTGGTLSGSLNFSNSNGHITWNSSTYQQRIQTIDDSNADTGVFSFQQSSDSGSNWTDLMTIKDNGKVVATTFVGNLSGNATSATKLQTARTIALTGSVTGSGSFDGSGNLSIATTTNHTHSYLPLSGGTVTGVTQFNNYLKLNAWSGYGTGTANFWYDANNKFVEIQNATDLKLAGTKVSKEGHTHNYLPISGGTLTGDVVLPITKSSLDGSLPVSSATMSISDITSLSNYKTYLGSYQHSGVWYNLISTRHRNGSGDGSGYGMYFRSELTSSSNLTWGKQYGANSWQAERTILDSSNYNTYAPTKTGTGASGTWGINISGSAAKLTTARTISLTGSVVGSGSFDGSGDLSISTTTNHTHDDRYYTESEINTKLNAKLNTSLKGTANGLAELDSNGRVPSNQLPSYVDDVIEGYLYNSKFYKESAHTTEITGETGKIYIDLTSNKTYRWSGSAFSVISETLALGETSSTAYRGDRGKIAYDHSQAAHAPSNAEVNQNAFSNVVVGSTTIAADSKTDTLTLIAGSNVTITPDATNDKITISSTNTDTKVTQTAITASDYTNWRPLIWGASNSSTEGFTPTTVTDSTFTANTISCQPSSGTIRASVFKGSLSGNASSSTKLTTSAGSATQPIYFSDGKPVVCTYSLGKSVPSDAVFTDTHYTTRLKVGASATATANAAASNGSVYINILDNTTIRDSHKITGAGATTVTSDENGVITINSTNTTYTAGSGLTLSGTQFKHSNSVTASTAQGDANKTLAFGGTFTIPTITYDATGHITGKGTTTMTMPANPNTDTKVRQQLYSSNYNLPLLMSYQTNANTDTNVDNIAFRNNSIYANPSTGMIASTSQKIGEHVTLQYNSSTESLDFVFS